MFHVWCTNSVGFQNTEQLYKKRNEKQQKENSITDNVAQMYRSDEVERILSMGGVERLMGTKIAVCVMYEMNVVQREQFVWFMVG